MNTNLKKRPIFCSVLKAPAQIADLCAHEVHENGLISPRHVGNHRPEADVSMDTEGRRELLKNTWERRPRWRTTVPVGK